MNYKNITKPAANKIIIVAGLIFIAVFCFAADSKNKPVQKSPMPADIRLVKNHLTIITQTPEFRNHENRDQLNAIADYVKENFSKYGDSTTFQEYQVEGKIYKNVITSFGTEHTKRIIIGAHYDVCGDQQGADDNATGVTALLELARMLKGQKLNYRIDLVAYTLEEPPYFRTENMGSYIHAQYLKNHNIEVYGMTSVEMIGYFKDEKDLMEVATHYVLLPSYKCIT